MVEPEFQDVPTWMESGLLHLQHLDYAEALNCFRQALMLNPSLPEGWLNYGSVLEKLGCYGAAIAANTNAQKLYATSTLRLAPPEPEPTDAIAAALSLQTSSADYWLGRGDALCDQGHYDQAIASYDKALSLRPDDPQAWFGRGNMAAAMGEFETAIASYNKATEFEPNDYQAWNNRGYALHRLGQYEGAIASYDRAIDCKADCYPAWNNRGFALYHLGQHEAAIVEFDQALVLNPSHAEAWHNRGNALKALGRLEEAIIDYDKALALKPEFEEARENRAIVLQALKVGVDGDKDSVEEVYIDLQPTDSESQFNSGQRYYRKGKNQYIKGSKQLNPFPDWLAAEESYIKALELLRIEDFAAQHLTILQELLTLRARLLSPQENLAQLQEASAKLQRILQSPELTLGQRLTLERQFEGFNQLQVDALAQQNPIQALELAEASKNRCLGRLRDSWAYQSPNYTQIQTLLSPRTAALYWHLSPAALTTFILKHNQPPQILESKPAPTEPNAPPSKTAYPPAAYQLRELETWLKTWKQDYSTARDLPPQATSPWRERMEWMLYARLRTILETPRICLDYLQDIDQLILIPHRDLHLIPLHALFPERYTVTYLPSAQLGLELQHHPTPSLKRLLSIEDPATQWVKTKGTTNGMLYAQLESALVTQLYGKAITQSVPRETATKLRVTAALKLMSGCLHFTGHSYHNPENPAQSALALAGEDLLTLKDLWQLDLHQYNLVCLSSCETGITITQSITDEYIGLISGFLCAGAAHVISTLWPVDEISSALLMIEFHHNLLKEALPPAKALTKAQQWLRNLTYADLSGWYQSHADSLATIGLQDRAIKNLQRMLQDFATVTLDEPEQHIKPYEHPFYWAGFTLTGKISGE